MPNNYVDNIVVNGVTNDIHDSRTFNNVAFSGDYTGLINKPTIPSKTSDLTNDSGFVTSTTVSSTYATKAELEEVEEEIPSLTGYATETWVNNQGFVTSASVAGLASKSYVDTQDALKQDKLTAGSNISIAANGTISATDTIYTAGDNITIAQGVISATVPTVPTKVSDLTNDANYQNATQVATAVSGKQNTLTAGSNISIVGDTISATDTTYSAGTNITIVDGVISATGGSSYTAGANINITDGVISATDTTYTAGSNVTISNGVISANVPFYQGGSDINIDELDNTISTCYGGGTSVQFETKYQRNIVVSNGESINSGVTDFNPEDFASYQGKFIRISDTVGPFVNMAPISDYQHNGDFYTWAVMCGWTINYDSAHNVMAIGNLQGINNGTYKFEFLNAVESISPISSTYIPVATTSAIGGVKVDGTSITISNGTISAVGGGGTTYTAGTGIDITSNVISAKTPVITVLSSQVISQNPITMQFTNEQAAIVGDESVFGFELDLTALGMGKNYWKKSYVTTNGYNYECVTEIAFIGRIEYNTTTKQGVYYSSRFNFTAGSNVNITNGVISATDTTYTAGDNITINNGVISATGGGGSNELYPDISAMLMLVRNDQLNFQDSLKNVDTVEDFKKYIVGYIPAHLTSQITVSHSDLTSDNNTVYIYTIGSNGETISTKTINRNTTDTLSAGYYIRERSRYYIFAPSLSSFSAYFVKNINYLNTTSGLTATTLSGAIDELASRPVYTAGTGISITNGVISLNLSQAEGGSF